MLRLTILTKENSSYLFSTHFKSLFSTAKPYTYKKDVWDFGDKLCIGNRATNDVNLWEAIERTAAQITMDNKQQDIYIDVFNSTDEMGFGPCERKTQECIRFDVKNISLEMDDHSESLLISLKNPEAIDDIYENLEYLLKDVSFSASKYEWIGLEETYKRPHFISRKMNEKKKKEILAKTPRIALTAVVNNNRKRA